MVDVTAFQLSPSQLAEVRDRMSAAIQEGLTADDQQVAALPAYLPPPSSGLTGEALVVDTGGTNMRAAWVELRGEREPIVKAGPISQKLGVRGDQRVDRATFFRMQAALVEALQPPKRLPVGYVFSYPSETLPNLDARLIKWTKGIDLPDVVDTLVGRGLFDALTSVEPVDVRVLNDTVAALIATSLIAGSTPQHGIGLIAGTGTNMACYANAQTAPKLAAKGLTGSMAINLESGNFSPPFLTEADDAVDRNSIAPGHQRFEKALSGYYLPFIFQAAYPEHEGFDPTVGTQALVELVQNAPHSDAGRLAAAILHRAADFVAAGLAAVIDGYEAVQNAPVLAEGSLFWRAPGFADRTRQTLRSLLPDGVGFTIHQMTDANLFGAAAAALAR